MVEKGPTIVGTIKKKRFKNKRSKGKQGNLRDVKNCGFLGKKLRLGNLTLNYINQKNPMSGIPN